jgi:hypothetical protein
VVPTNSTVPNAALQASRLAPQQHHTNAVIEAGHVRARDEVSCGDFRIPIGSMLIQLIIARHIQHVTKRSI